MKNSILRSFLTLFFVMLFFSTSSIALAGPWQGWRGSGGWGMKGKYQRNYDPATVETRIGEVTSVEQITPVKGMYYGIHCILKTSNETISIHLGPSWYIERLDTQILPGDNIEVTGSRVTIQGQPAIIAARIKKGEEQLTLRNDDGIPAWSGRSSAN